MTQDLANIEQTKRAIDDVRLQIESLERIETQLKIHLQSMESS